ncbi:R3H domain-containing protein 2 isoform X1, partial [Sigmodon hispidus]
PVCARRPPSRGCACIRQHDPTSSAEPYEPFCGVSAAPGSEQYQMPQSPSPCSPPQMLQQFSGVSPSGPGVVVMQLNVPNGPQAPQNPSMVQWSHCKYYNVDQRGQKPGDLYNPDGNPQANAQNGLQPRHISYLVSSTFSCHQPQQRLHWTRSPDCPHAIPPAWGSCTGCLPLLHGQSAYTVHQGQSGLKHGSQGRRQALKSASTDLGTADVMLGRVLEVTDLPEGITRTEADKLFTQLSMSGAKIQWGDNIGTAENGRLSDLSARYTIVAVFPSPSAAQNASLCLNNSVSCFKLRVANKN